MGMDDKIFGWNDPAVKAANIAALKYMAVVGALNFVGTCFLWVCFL
jgi:hypothetical protein